MTGTVLQGKVAVGQLVEISANKARRRRARAGNSPTGTPCPAGISPDRPGGSCAIAFPCTQEKKKVKSMQMFHKPVQSAHKGDRVGWVLGLLPVSAPRPRRAEVRTERRRRSRSSGR